MTFADHVLSFNKSLRFNNPLPANVEVLNPYQDEFSFRLCEQFYKKFYNDSAERTLIIGINPGRFGGGITGIPFTDPLKLEVQCGVSNALPKKVELSADFIYKMIDAYGGVNKFYSQFYITAVSPLGFTSAGKNMNYYDSKELQTAAMDFIINCMQRQLGFGVNREICYCLGEGDNFKFLNKLNQQNNFFEKIVSLPHPRFIMQYRRKHLDVFIQKYLTAFSVLTDLK